MDRSGPGKATPAFNRCVTPAEARIVVPESDRKTYNLSWVGKSAGLPAIEAIEGFLAPIFGRVEQLL